MPFIPKANTFRKGILIYRRIRHRRGHGVHSPFVFNLITKVIEEKTPYYSLHDIELLKKQLLLKEEKITYPDRHHAGKIRTRPINQIVKKEAISGKQGALLFRLANYFKCKKILQIGTSMGLSTLYMASWSKETQCIALEQIKEFAVISDSIYQQFNQPVIISKTGKFQQTLPEAFQQIGIPDLIYINTPHDGATNEWLIQICLEHTNDQTLLIINGIHRNTEMRKLWKKICSHSITTVTLDLYHLGIVFFNKKLHKRNYINYF